MKQIISLILISFIACAAPASNEKFNHKSIEFVFASLEEAKSLLTSEDEYTRAWSSFDIAAKCQQDGCTKAEYIEHIEKQALDWTVDDKKKLTSVIDRISQSMEAKKFSLHLDDPIYLVKTTSDEEGGAMGYTRGSYIVLSQAMSGMSDEDLDHLVAHELFHVISRKKPALREKLYDLIGFKMMKEVSYPAAIKDYRITNPDATQTDTYINLKVGEETIPCMMILYSNRPYDGGSFFKYLNIGFLRLNLDESPAPVIGVEGPEIYSMKEISGFYEQVGKNTNYIIHPEEILADNFTFALFGKENLKNPELVEKIDKVLKE